MPIASCLALSNFHPDHAFGINEVFMRAVRELDEVVRLLGHEQGVADHAGLDILKFDTHVALTVEFAESDAKLFRGNCHE